MARKTDEFRDHPCSKCGAVGRTCLASLPSSSIFLSEEERKKPRKIEYTCVDCLNGRHKPKQEEVAPVLELKVEPAPSLFRRVLRWFLRLFGVSLV